MYEIIASTTFKLSLDRLIYFLEHKYSAQKAIATKGFIKKIIIENLSENPHIAPVSSRLVTLGIKDYRQYSIDEHNLLFYRIDDETKKVILSLIMDSRQSIQKLLHEVMLLS